MVEFDMFLNEKEALPQRSERQRFYNNLFVSTRDTPDYVRTDFDNSDFRFRNSGKRFSSHYAASTTRV